MWTYLTLTFDLESKILTTAGRNVLSFNCLVSLLVGRRTCDLQVAGLSHGWAPLRIVALGKLLLHLCASVTKQYNFVPAKGVISLAGKVTAGLVESNGSLPPGL